MVESGFDHLCQYKPISLLIGENQHHSEQVMYLIRRLPTYILTSGESPHSSEVFISYHIHVIFFSYPQCYLVLIVIVTSACGRQDA